MPSKRYWFRAKTHGWGWGLPLVWQGWMAYGMAAVLLFANFFVFPPAGHPVPFIVTTWVVALLLIAVCWIKGEPLR